MQTEDGSIIQECINGEPGAFGVLVDKYKEGIYAFVYSKLQDFQDAEDVTQEVFLRAYRGLRGLRRWESFAFWLYRIAYARCAELLKLKSKRAGQEFIEDQPPEVINTLSRDSYHADQLNELVRDALNSLPEIHREVLVLCYFSGMKSREMARAMGISPAAIRKRLSRARAQLREEMILMMDIAFEGQRLPAGFTIHIVELLKHMKIQPMPRLMISSERFFWAFNQFYKKRCGFFPVFSAKRELILFLVMYLFIRQPESGKAPIESIMPDAREMPLYKLINDPLRTVMGVENVNRNVRMADSELLQCA